jgi:Fur family ferric uptake transcriptional regulator
MGWIDGVIDTLAEERHRITEPRRNLLQMVAGYRSPFTAEQLYADVRDAHPSIGRATVYRTLDLLHARGWLSRVHREDGEHAYVLADSGHQHYLVCKGCGEVTAFEGCDLDALLGGLASRLGFEIEGHWLEAFGRCRRCRRASGQPA